MEETGGHSGCKRYSPVSEGRSVLTGTSSEASVQGSGATIEVALSLRRPTTNVVTRGIAQESNIDPTHFKLNNTTVAWQQQLECAWKEQNEPKCPCSAMRIGCYRIVRSRD